MVIVADDSPTFRRMLVSGLGLLGHRGLEAATLDQLDAMLAADRPDVILLDWGLAGDHGATVAERLVGRATAVVIVTGDPDTVAAIGIPVLSKPFGLEELRQALDDSVSVA